jgi:hypothetical protein
MTTPSGDIVPRSNGSGKLGTTIKKWLEGHFFNIFATGGTISGVNMISEIGETISGPVTTSAGIGDAMKLASLGVDGKLSLSFMPDGVAGEIDSIATSSGSIDAGKIPELDLLGLLDLSFFPEGIGGTTFSGVTVSSGVVDAGKIPELGLTGKLDLSFFPEWFGNSEISMIVASESLSSGDIVNIYEYNGPKCRKAYAGYYGKEAHGFISLATESGTTTPVYYNGINSNVYDLVPGKQFLSTTVSGLCTSTIPYGSKVIFQVVGFATSATSMIFQRETPIVLS